MPLNVTINVDASKSLGEWRQIYRFFGTDEINYVYMKDGKKLMKKLGDLGGKHQVFFRSHSQFCTGEGVHALKWGSTNAYTEDAQGNAVYDWAIVDKVYDAYLEAGVKPYVQFAFMPEALSTKPQPYQHSWTPTAPYDEIFTGWTYPPKDYKKWQDLIYEFTKHCIERYGKAECESWYWETWNEPDIGYWRGTEEEFCQLTDHALEGVRRALPKAIVGGPETTGRGVEYLRNFLQHCDTGTNKATGQSGTPLDFVSFHAKGQPKYIKDGDFVRMGISTQLKEIDTAFKTISSFKKYQHLPVVIGESDPEGAAAAQGPELAYRNSTMYSSYTAASFARKHDLADKHGVNLEGAITWAYEFEDQPYFAGFRILSSNDVDLPVLNIFRMFAKMQGNRIQAVSNHQVSLDDILSKGVREKADIGAVATRDGNNLAIFVWHYHDDNLKGETAQVSLNVTHAGISGSKLEHWRVDEHHSNAYTQWLDMKSPQSPTASQIDTLQQAAVLQRFTGETKVEKKQDDEVVVSFELPRQGVTLLRFTV